MKRKPLTEAQRRVMTYLTHQHGNHLAWREYARGWIVFNAAGESVMTQPARAATVSALLNSGLLDHRDRHYTASDTAWALLTEGELL